MIIHGTAVQTNHLLYFLLLTIGTMQSDEHLTTSNASRILGVHPNTLRKWESQGVIDCIRVRGGHRLFNISKFKRDQKEEDQGKSKSSREKTNYIYARVSSPKQSEDLKRQARDLEASYPGFQVLSDTGSGINFKRKGFKRLLQEIMRGNVGKIVVSYRDRLCRIAFDLLEFICDQHQTELLVHNQDKEGSDDKELLEDLMAITHVFSSRLYGKRSHKSGKRNPKKRKEHDSNEAVDNTTEDPDDKRVRSEPDESCAGTAVPSNEQD
jgi:putative resolvase